MQSYKRKQLFCTTKHWALNSGPYKLHVKKLSSYHRIIHIVSYQLMTTACDLGLLIRWTHLPTTQPKRHSGRTVPCLCCLHFQHYSTIESGPLFIFPQLFLVRRHNYLEAMNCFCSLSF